MKLSHRTRPHLPRRARLDARYQLGPSATPRHTPRRTPGSSRLANRGTATPPAQLTLPHDTDPPHRSHKRQILPWAPDSRRLPRRCLL